MLTMFPFDMIDRYAQKNGWIIHRVERTISASKSSRRRQEEWMGCNYEERAQASLFEGGYLGELGGFGLTPNTDRAAVESYSNGGISHSLYISREK